ncbi:MAG: DUF2505 family protein [Bdellovibrionota bacterium]
MKIFHAVHEFPCPREKLFTLFDEPDYQTFLIANIPELAAFEVLEDRWEGGRRFRRMRFRVVAPMPDFVRRVAPRAGQGWIEESGVLDPQAATYESHAQGTVSEIRRLVRYEGGPESTRRVSESRISARVPLVGGALERFMASQMEKNRDQEYQITLRYLRGERA